LKSATSYTQIRTYRQTTANISQTQAAILEKDDSNVMPITAHTPMRAGSQTNRLNHSSLTLNI